MALDKTRGTPIRRGIDSEDLRLLVNLRESGFLFQHFSADLFATSQENCRLIHNAWRPELWRLRHARVAAWHLVTDAVTAGTRQNRPSQACLDCH